jgi:signal transduction histidine kinase
MSLRTKLILAFSGIVIGLVFFLVFFVNLDNSRQVQDFMTRGGMYGYGNVVRDVEAYYQTHGSWDGIESIANSLQPGMMGGNMGMGMGTTGPAGEGPGGKAQFTITDAALKVVWSSAGEVVGTTLSSDVKKTAIILESTSNNVIGYLLVSGQRSFQTSEVSPLIQNLKTVVFRSGLIAAILAFIIAIVVSNSLIRPVKLLTQAADSLAHGKLSTRVNVHGKDEIALLGSSFNVMAENLEAAEARKKALTADIAHELRSPLAVQRAQLEAMQDGIIPINQENLQTVVDQTNFLTRLVDDLRTLALVDAGELPLQMENIDILKVCTQVVERFKPQAAQQQVHLGFTNSTDKNEIIINADPDRIMQILGNLITNALHHTGKDGSITIDIHAEKEAVIASVKDNGCGIPESDLPHHFERFFKGDKSRNRENSRSTGLGLSIARNLARVHGGDLTAANNPDGGANFVLTLPAK